jgi:L-2-hydroxyglutarate oxidase
MRAYDIAIVGGGIFGCSIAKHLADQTNFDVCVIEKEYEVANHQSGRNSGTLHVGVVNEAKVEAGSQIAHFTVEGARRLKSYCRDNNLPLLDRGIMKVGQSDDEIKKLRDMYEDAAELDVNLKFLESQDEIHEKEPNITGQAALYTPDSATVDAGAITRRMAQDAYESGVDFCTGTKVTKVLKNGGEFRIQTNKSDVLADYFINAAGVKALKFAHEMGIGHEYEAVPFRGVYYELVPQQRSLVKSNVYPTSIGPSFQVGVHFTRRPDNRVIVGPTGMIAKGSETYRKTEINLREILSTVSSTNFWKFMSSTEKMRLAVDEINKTYRKSVFLDRCRKLIPEVSSKDIEESYVGISHWLFDQDGQRVGEPVIEFSKDSAHVLLPQPGFTSSMPIGEYVADTVQEQL